MEYPNATTRYKYTLDIENKSMTFEYPGRTELDIEADDRDTITFVFGIRAEDAANATKNELRCVARSLIFEIDRFVGDAQVIYWAERPNISYDPESQMWIARASLDA